MSNTTMHLSAAIALATIGCISEADPSIADAALRAEATRYLEAYGYLDDAPAGASLSDDEFDTALRRLQRWVDLPQTGRLDEATIALIRMPRCGVPDRRPAGAQFATHGRWPSNQITYTHASYTADLPQGEQQSVVADALAKWAAAAPVLSFARVAAGGNISISFVPATHDQGGGDVPFTGTQRGHAFWPGHPSQGVVHFNDDLLWRTNGEVHDLPTVALHELGHALGLDHSTNTSAVMYFGVAASALRRELAPDDIDGIRALYLASPTAFNAPEHCMGLNNVHWSTVPDATEYRLYRSYSPAFTNPTLIGAYAASPAAIIVEPNATWYLRVRACNTHSCSESNQVSASYWSGPCD